MKKSKLIILILVLLSLLLAGLVFSLRDSKEAEDNNDQITDEPQEELRSPERELKDATITLYSDDGGTKWELRAEAIKEYQQPSEYVLEVITAEVYEAEQKVLAVTAQSGTIDGETDFLSLEGPIQLESDNRKIRADRVNWNQSKNQIIGRGNILISQPGMQITGDSFVTKIDLRRLEIIDDVHVNAKAGEKNEI